MVLAAGFGTSVREIFKLRFQIATVLVISAGVLSGCQTWFSSDNQEAESEDDDEGSDGEKPDATDLSHPKQPSAWNTKMLVIMNPMPSKSQLEICRGQFAALGKLATSPDALRSAETQAINTVEQNLVLYHWCFYHTMNLLDEKLSNDQMEVNYSLKYSNFLATMKSLWILARAMDRSSKTKAYFTYLRRRYVDLSRQHFVRNVDVLGLPLGNFQKVYSKPKSGSQNKPAGESDVDL